MRPLPTAVSQKVSHNLDVLHVAAAADGGLLSIASVVCAAVSVSVTVGEEGFGGGGSSGGLWINIEIEGCSEANYNTSHHKSPAPVCRHSCHSPWSLRSECARPGHSPGKYCR